MRLFSLLDTQYNDFVTKIQSYFSKALSKNNTSFGSNTIFGQIITVVGNAIHNVMLYIEDALVEQNKYTAQRKKSIYGLASLSGYEPSLGKAALATIKLSFMPNNKDAYNVILKNKEQLTCTQNGLKYNVLLPQEAIVLNVNKDNSIKYFSAVQGLFESQRFISTGGKYYTVNFKFIGNIDTDYIIVKVNNEIWEAAASIYDMQSDGKQYTVKTGVNGGIDLIFGNEIHGRALKANDVIDVEYLIHDGELGNVDPNLETYFTFDNVLSDTNGDSHDANTLFNVMFAELDPITAGSNSETIDVTRQMIGFNSRSLVLASPENYKVLINRFGFCGYNRTWSDPNSFVVNSMIIKNFKADLSSGNDYFNLTENDFYLSQTQKESIYNFIKNSGGQLAATKYNICDPELCKYAMYIYIKTKSNKYDKDLIKKQIKHQIGEFFMNIQSDMFIPKSDIVHLIKSNVDGIDGVDVYFLSQKNEEAIYKGQYTNYVYEVNNLTGQYIKKIENVKIYPGENPNLGLDNHGNIYLKSDTQFPVLMGGWDYKNNNDDLITVNDPITITFED
jgi:hypothetical protein